MIEFEEMVMVEDRDESIGFDWRIEVVVVVVVVVDSRLCLIVLLPNDLSWIGPIG